MKPGTHLILRDGREATVVYNSLAGYGVRFGHLNLSDDDVERIYRGDGNTIQDGCPDDYELAPEAMLRDPYKGATLPCVGSEFEIVD